jgi:hypothetical protein
VTVGSGGASTVAFTSIPSTYTHLQIRGIARDNGGGTSQRVLPFRINSDSGSNYAQHLFAGNGTSISASGATSQTYANASNSIVEAGTLISTFGAFVVDILDYTNTNKYKTIRSLYGSDTNGNNEVSLVGLYSGLWMSTSAINSITFYLRGALDGTFAQYSHLALYGVN